MRGQSNNISSAGDDIQAQVLGEVLQMTFYSHIDFMFFLLGSFLFTGVFFDSHCGNTFQIKN